MKMTMSYDLPASELFKCIMKENSSIDSLAYNVRKCTFSLAKLYQLCAHGHIAIGYCKSLFKYQLRDATK